MLKLVSSWAAVVVTFFVMAPIALAGSAHFIDNAFTFSQTGNTITVSGKEAGLGDLSQVHVVLSATAECVNPGGNTPNADNKKTVSTAGDFPVQNGKANFNLSVTATFSPNPAGACSNVRYSDITVTDTTNNVTHSF